AADRRRLRASVTRAIAAGGATGLLSTVAAETSAAGLKAGAISVWKLVAGASPPTPGAGGRRRPDRRASPNTPGHAHASRPAPPPDRAAPRGGGACPGRGARAVRGAVRNRAAARAGARSDGASPARVRRRERRERRARSAAGGYARGGDHRSARGPPRHAI